MRQTNPHTCEPKDAPLSPEEYAQFQREYELWRQMRDSQRYRVNGGDDTIHEPIGEDFTEPF
jgi:hypothetical protein